MRGAVGVPWVGWAIATLIAVGGCAVRDDPKLNAYAPNNGEPTLLEAAERVMEQAERAVHDLEGRLEYAVY